MMAAPSTLWLVEGEHHGVPGRITKVCATREAADREAAELVTMLCKDNLNRVATPQDWPAALSEHQTHMTDRYEPDELGYVEVNAVELIS